ncbi:MAG: HAMP domain-containing histidine kinase [Geodermatophilaceae bacterium]|nr:HAMP domain-containing histidine kinase [Geodermatophilaceae bacterium]
MRVSLRWRLALAYGALLSVAAAILLAVAVIVADQTVAATPGLPPDTQVEVVTADGATVTVSAAAVQEALRDQARDAILRTGGLAFGFVVLAGSAASYLVAGRVLSPVSELTVIARRLSTATLAQRISYSGPRDELADLAGAFDEMVRRLDAAFAGQQRFAANASHELRTPLTLIRTEVDVALSDPNASVDELRTSAEIVREATIRADALVESLLLLARSEAEAQQGMLSRRESVDLADLVPGALAAVGSETTERDLSVESSLAPAGTVGDPELLSRLVGNLVENGVRHNTDGGALSVGTGRSGGRVWLVVSNSGPVFEQAELADLLTPFRRGGAGRSGVRGVGLGLSIVRAVVAAHHGTVDLIALPEGGMEVRITLPAGGAARL